MKKFMVFALAIAMVMGLVSMASAAVTVGGSSRFTLAYGNQDEDNSGLVSGEDKASLTDLYFKGSSSRLKFKWASEDKKFGAQTSIGIRSKYEKKDLVHARKIEFWYNVGGNGLQQIKFGQMGHVVSSSGIGPGQALFGDGMCSVFYDDWGRRAGIELTLLKKNPLKLAVYTPDKRGIPTYDTGKVDDKTGKPVLEPVLKGAKPYALLPTLAAAWNVSAGNFMISPWVNYELVQWKNAKESDSYSALDAGLRLNGDFGLVGFSLAGWYGMNSAGSFGSSPIYYKNKKGDDFEKENHTFYSVWGELRIHALSLGAGYAAMEIPNPIDKEKTIERNQLGAYANFKIPFGPIVFIPEVMWRGYGKFDKVGNGGGFGKQGNAIFAGVYTRIDF